jgi:uncharacterized membrane protein YhaH (DUF805 family)
MTAANPYQSPRAAVADTAEEYQPVKIFAVSGRIGRARYIAYTLGLTILVYAVAAVVGGGIAAVGGGSAGAGVLMFVAWAFMIVLSVMLTIQRAHDFNASGWLSIIAFIPLVNLIFWFIPGTDGENRYGAPPPPNSTLVTIGALVVPVVMAVGILAAVAIPAYSDYTKRAQAAAQK